MTTSWSPHVVGGGAVVGVLVGAVTLHVAAFFVGGRRATSSLVVRKESSDEELRDDGDGGVMSALRRSARRADVFRAASVVLADYRVARVRARRARARRGLADDDPDPPDVAARWEAVHERGAARLARFARRSGGFWVKVGQYLSSRADVVPAAYVRELASLQDALPPRPFADVVRTLRGDASAHPSLRVEDVDPAPLATASLAQVHRAFSSTTKNEEWVVKVRHRGVASLLRQDMDNLAAILRFVAWLEPDVDFAPVVREYDREVRRELDFRLEARNMEEVRVALRDHDVIVPRTVSASERVLVMEYCPGVPARDVAALDALGVDRELLVERVCRAWAAQMHSLGLFNADPHPGNVLVSTARNNNGDASVPVLLDFGLCRRFDDDAKLAFARLMHAADETDVDALLRSFEEMGMRLNRYDPFEDMANMRRAFRDTEPATEARENRRVRAEAYRAREQAMKRDQRVTKLRNPVDAWPPELVFYGRVTNMLRGLCSRLDVRHPYLTTMADVARRTLREAVPAPERATDLVHPSSARDVDVDSPLQRKLTRAIRDLRAADPDCLVGCQVAVRKSGSLVASVAAGVLGRANPRPVTRDTLFCVFSVSKAILATGLLRLIEDGRLALDDPVVRCWPAFRGKDDVTVRHVLSHTAGLHDVLPLNDDDDDNGAGATLDALLDWEGMKAAVASERTTPSHAPGTETHYHYLSFAWLCGGIIEAVTGEPYEKLLRDVVVQPLGLEKTLHMAGLPASVDEERDVAVLTVDRDHDDNTTTTTTTSPPSSRRRPVLTKYRGREQLASPSVFNMRRVRRAKLPSANGHASAEALARALDAVVDGTVLSRAALDRARATTTTARGATRSGAALLSDASSSRFGLGFQTHEVVLSSSSDEVARTVGHGGLGGSIALSVPELDLTFAFTTNRLSGSDLRVRNSLLRVVADEYGATLPSYLTTSP